MLQVLTTAPTGIVDQLPKDIARLGRYIGGLGRRSAPAKEPPQIEVSGLTVRFGGVTSLDGMSVTFESGTCGLIGPNGAGKTTFFNVLSGFVRPASGQRQRVRRGPAVDGPLPPRALGPAPYVPDRAGDREPDRLRERGHDP